MDVFLRPPAMSTHTSLMVGGAIEERVWYIYTTAQTEGNKGKICAPFSDRNSYRTFMVCLHIHAGRTGIWYCLGFCKCAAFRRMCRLFTARSRALWCGHHSVSHTVGEGQCTHVSVFPRTTVPHMLHLLTYVHVRALYTCV